MAVAALLATAGSTNVTLFGSTNLTATLADMGQFPPFLGRSSRLGRHAGLLITAGLVLIVANLVDLSAIASVGSACSLIVFVLVGVAGYQLREEPGANAWMVLLGLTVTIVVLAFFAVDTLQNAPETFTAIIGITALAVGIDLVWKRVRPALPAPSGESRPAPSTRS
jgi:amino acid transporter